MLAPLGWALVAAAAGLVAAPLEPNLLEEGIVVHTAERMVQGDHLYRDVISHTAPLPYELLAGLFRLFGTELLVARAAVVLLQALGAAATFGFARGAGLAAHAAAAAVASAPILLMPLFSTFYYTTVAFYLGLLAVLAATLAPASGRAALSVGALLAAVALCKQSTGVLFALLLPLALAFVTPGPLRRRRIAQGALGAGGVALATLALYAWRGDLGDFVWSQLELAWVMGSAQSFRTPYMNLWPPGTLAPEVRESWVMYLPSLYHLRHGLLTEIGRGIVLLTQLLYVLPPAALIATLFRWRGAAAPRVALLHGAFLATMTANLYPRADWGHLVVALPAAVVQLLLLLPRGRTQRVASVAVLFGLLAGAAGTGVWLHGVAGEPSFGPRVPLRPVSRAYTSPAVPRVIRYLRARVPPGDPIFVARQEPLLYFATGTRNPTPFEGILQGARALQQGPILEALPDVRYVVMSDIDQPLYTYYADELPAVWAHLERHYRIPGNFPLDDASWIVVLARGPDRGETALDLVERRPEATAWIRNDALGIQPAVGELERLAARQLRRPIPIALGALGGGLDYSLEVPANAVFQSAVGYRGVVSVNHQHFHPRGTHAVVSLRVDGEADFEELLRVRIDDRPRGGRHWTPIEAPLDLWAGRRVTLRLEFRASRPLGRDRVAWFGSPRIALRTDTAAAASILGTAAEPRATEVQRAP